MLTRKYKYSGDTLNKAASSHYNERVIECRIAAQVSLIINDDIVHWITTYLRNTLQRIGFDLFALDFFSCNN